MERKIGKSTLTPILFSGCDVYVKNSSNLNSTTFLFIFPADTIIKQAFWNE